jgi:hypothetical protein
VVFGVEQIGIAALEVWLGTVNSRAIDVLEEKNIYKSRRWQGRSDVVCEYV